MSSQLVIRNNRLFTINVTSITFDAGANLVNATSIASGFLVSPGSAVLVVLSFTGASPCTKSQSFSKNVVILYKDATYGVAYTFTGEKPLVGTCQ
ncbi:MAG: hypothetical protein NT130_00750 [Candidatus Micrarchaeota archaeon]|nr:hypothetical protein [Candidatus Micrarchaeota archaeon]